MIIRDCYKSVYYDFAIYALNFTKGQTAYVEDNENGFIFEGTITEAVINSKPKTNTCEDVLRYSHDYTAEFILDEYSVVVGVDINVGVKGIPVCNVKFKNIREV